MKSYLRAEARSLTWSEMQDSQRAAFEKLIGMIEQSIKDLPERPLTDEETIRWRNQRRTSRTAFLMGGRGSGKSSVLATLENALDRQLLDQAGYSNELQSTIRAIRSRVVLLKPLDAELIVRSRNLPAAILTRVEESCNLALGKSMQQESTRGLLAPGEQNLSQKLRRLLIQASIAWDSDVAERRPYLDPTQMALESLQHEQAQLSVDEELNLVLQRAAEVYRTETISNPLFLLPVDDFDLNPPACVQLLKVIRMISSPRLFFVLLGDVDVSEVVLRLHQSAVFVQEARRILDTEYLAVEPEEVTQHCRVIAGNMLRKLIPPTHRMKLTSPQLSEALNLRLLGAAEGELRLHEILEKIPTFVANHDPTQRGKLQVLYWPSLRERLLQPGFKVIALKATKSSSPSTPEFKGSLTETDLRECANSTRTMFCTSLRRLADLWLGFKEIADKAEPRKRDVGEQQTHTDHRSYVALRGFLHDECTSLLEEEPAISSIDRNRLLHSFASLPRVNWFLGNLPVEVSTQTYAAFELGLAIQTSKSDPLPQYQFRSFGEWQVAPRQLDSTTSRAAPLNSDAGSVALLTPTTSATLALFHDLVVSAVGSRNSGSFIIDNQRATARWASTVWRVGQREASLSWPVPPCPTFSAIDRLGFAWNDFLISANDEALQVPENVDFAAFAWISAGMSVLDYRDPVTCSPNGQPLPWDQLMARIIEPRPEWKPRTFQWWRWRTWQVLLADFLLPEFGAPLTNVTWPKEIRKVWDEEQASIVQRRRLHLASLWNSMPELVKKWAPATFQENSRSFRVSQASIERVAAGLDPGDDLEETTVVTKSRRPTRRLK